MNRATTKKVDRGGKASQISEDLDVSKSRLDIGGGSLWGRDSSLVKSNLLDPNKSNLDGFDLSGANLWKEGSEAGSSNLDKSKVSKSEMSRLEFQSGSLWGADSSLIQSNPSDDLQSKGSVLESAKKSKISSFAHSSVLSRHPPDHKITEESREDDEGIDEAKDEDDIE